VGFQEAPFKLGALQKDAGLIRDGVISQLVPFLHGAQDNLFVSGHTTRDEEESGMRIVLPEQIQNLGGGPGVRPVVNRQRHGLFLGLDEIDHVGGQLCKGCHEPAGLEHHDPCSKKQNGESGGADFQPPW
jgi:hypothetical protein